MSELNQSVSDEIMVALRRIMRAVDIHSRRLAHTHGLTGPQAMVLKALISAGELTVGDLARQVTLGQATTTEIVQRLERHGLVAKHRSTVDKRRVYVSPTEEAVEIFRHAPPLLQERFAARLETLADWERTLLLSSLQRIASLMDAGDIDAAPLLTSGPITDAGLSAPRKRTNKDDSKGVTA
ncbi:MarR family winged helix-turn-helix transcriptional regulator [Acidihalobacter prosperus]|uniref:Transcriptional regulator n=1 Tax=Acidihalobacter prosperus TaxID=160660 RepID=A0A1A6C6R7_9GAMM|nr:MarR family transcriptional regulator [Acidihalobacter prosperus]OBS10253.1 transcriptional regulator [Acidihalobacter prosperus]